MLIRSRGISIHALRMEGDVYSGGVLLPIKDFNPRPPHGGRRYNGKVYADQDVISIHALRMEGDTTGTLRTRLTRISIHALRMEGDSVDLVLTDPPYDFNPRPPHGGRQAPHGHGCCD